MSWSIDTAEFVGRTAMFAGLPRDVLEAVAGELRSASYTVGQTIFSRDEPAAGLYIVTAGRVRLSIRSSDGRELTVRHAEAGEVMGEVAALDGGPRTADAVPVSPVEVLALSAAAMQGLMRAHPALAGAAVQLMCTRLRETTSQLEEIALYPIERRVARFLVSAILLAGHDADAAEVPLDLKMSQGELALLLGASRPKVNVALGVLEKAMAITRKGEEILCHPAALRAFAGME